MSYILNIHDGNETEYNNIFKTLTTYKLLDKPEIISPQLTGNQKKKILMCYISYVKN